MGSGWWMASDHRWYPPELHPDVFHRAPTEELPAASDELPPPPSPHLVDQVRGRAVGPTTGPVSTGRSAGPSMTAPPMTGPPTQQLPFPPGQPPHGTPGGRSSTTAVTVIIVLVLLVVLLAGGLLAAVFALRVRTAGEPPGAIGVATTATTPTTLPTGPTTVPPEVTTPAEPSTTVGPTTTSTTTTTTLIPPPPQPPDDDRNPVMPDVVCIELPQAIQLVRSAGAGSVRTFDASGDGRRQIVHSNWIVVSQDPPAGDPVAGREVNLGVLKKGETTAC